MKKFVFDNGDISYFVNEHRFTKMRTCENRFAFLYKYNGNQRLIYKKI